MFVAFIQDQVACGEVDRLLRPRGATGGPPDRRATLMGNARPMGVAHHSDALVRPIRIRDLRNKENTAMSAIDVISACVM